MSIFDFPSGTPEHVQRNTDELYRLLMELNPKDDSWQPRVEKLLAGDICLEAKTTTRGVTLIGIAIEKRDRIAYDALLRRGANIHAQTVNKKTLLHLAANAGDEYICKSLIKHGVDTGAFDNDNYAPLHFAIKGNHISLYPLLIGKTVDANTNAGKPIKLSPLYLAFIQYKKANLPGKDTKTSLDSIKALLKMGANIYAGYISFHDCFGPFPELEALVNPSINAYRDFQENRHIHVIDDIYKILAATPLVDPKAPIDLEAQLRRIFSLAQWRRGDAAVMAEALYERGTVSAAFAEELTAIGSPDKKRTLSIGSGRGL